ncbi:MAG: DUF484 family protein [Gemmatimonas sp.]
MRDKPETAAPRAAVDITAAEVLAYLAAHPDFLVRHPDALDKLQVPGSQAGKGVVDLRSFMIERLRAKTRQLERVNGEIVTISRANLTGQSRIHAAALALLEATTFEALIQAVTTDLAVLLGVDVVVLAVESDGDGPLPGRLVAGVHMVPRGEVDRILGPGRDVVLTAAMPEPRDIFGPAADLVRSEALLRLRPSTHCPTGVLAIGSRTEGTFDPGQGTELLAFLARVVELCIRTWLDLPKA